MNDIGIIIAIVVAAIIIVHEMPLSPYNYKNDMHSIADSLSKGASSLYHMNLTLSLILRELTEMNELKKREMKLKYDKDMQYLYSDDTVISTEED